MPPHNPQPHPVHFVGSIPFSTPTEVFTTLSQALPSRISRLPDGETGPRWSFIGFQRDLPVFAAFPSIIRAFPLSPTPDIPPNTDPAAVVANLDPIHTGYDSAAIESYAVFRELRAKGVIPPGVRFQVSLPTATNFVGGHVKPEFQAALEPVYTEALEGALARIQASIPAADLAVQIDCAVDFALLEGAAWLVRPWFEGDVFDGVVDRIVGLADKVGEDVELGFHLCYGDIEGQHFAMAESMRVMVDVAVEIKRRVARPVAWFHMPVMQADAEFVAPLRELQEARGETELYFGVVGVGDAESSRKKIEAVGEVVSPFGIATECGLGRMARWRVDHVLRDLKEFSAPASGVEGKGVDS